MTGNTAPASSQQTVRFSELAQQKKSLTARVMDTFHGIINVSKGERKKSKEFVKGVKSNPLYQSDGEDVVLELCDEDPKRQYRKKGQKPRGQSTPALTINPPLRHTKPELGPRSSSQHTLLPFITDNVDRLKGQPLSLKEKMTRWCKKSPKALLTSPHEPPEDHYLAFPNPIYVDLMCDQYGRNVETLQTELTNGPTTKPRAECVLNRYPPRHGIHCTFDSISDVKNNNNNNNNQPQVHTTFIATEEFADMVSVRSVNTDTTGTATVNTDATGTPTHQAEETHDMTSPLPVRKPRKNLPYYPKRMPTNISLIPQSSRVCEEMVAGLNLDTR